MPDVLSGAVLTLAAVIVLSAAGVGIWKLLAGYRERTGVLKTLAAVMQETTAATKDSAAKLMEAAVAVRSAADTHGKAVALLERSLFGHDSKGYLPFDEESADRQYEIDTLVESGIPRDEAIARANERRVHEKRAKGDVISRMRLNQ